MTPQAWSGEKELKVRLPVRYHVQLHALKVLHGQGISFTVRMALDAYFRELEAARPADAAEPATPVWLVPQAEPPHARGFERP